MNRQKIIATAETILPISSPPISKGAVLIADGQIEEIGKAQNVVNKYRNIDILNLGKGLLLPGLVNAHTHLELGWITKKLGECDSFIEWIQQIIKAKADGATTEEIESSVENGIAMLIKNGVTTVGEVSSYDGLDKPLLKRSGLRTVLFTELFDRHEEYLDTLSFQDDGLFEERPFPHAPYSCSAGFLKRVLKSFGDREIPMGIHAAESAEEVKFIQGRDNDFENKVFPLLGKGTFERDKARTPLQYLKKLGLFDKTRFTLVHMVQVLPEEVEDLREFNLGVVLCPRSNFFLKVGTPPVEHYSKLQRIGIGTDGMSSNLNLDFLEELRFFYLTFARWLGRQAPFFTVYLATLGGARSLFLENKIGSLEPGKDADMVFLSPGSASSNPYLSVISSRQEDVKLVMVKGKILYSQIDHTANQNV
jgi:cytosine/adenosine deaminase-related metal-dependent hydrolase